MARWGSGERFLAAIEGIRAQEPDATFRSSFIVGFPGETESDHDTLLGFLDDAQLDWAGFFPFSEEAGTPAATLDGRVDDALMAERLRECEALQTEITQAARDALVLAEAPLEVLVDEVAGGNAVGRTHREAPEIDGVVHVEYDDDSPAPGDVVLARATGALGPDLYARAVHALRGPR
jgi:ribosomal protein S12 methylthiotransferase